MNVISGVVMMGAWSVVGAGERLEKALKLHDITTVILGSGFFSWFLVGVPLCLPVLIICYALDCLIQYHTMFVQ